MSKYYEFVVNEITKSIFGNEKITILDPGINSCELHNMTYRDTEILGIFCDYTGIHGEQLKEILIKGYLSSSVERN